MVCVGERESESVMRVRAEGLDVGAVGTWDGHQHHNATHV